MRAFWHREPKAPPKPVVSEPVRPPENKESQAAPRLEVSGPVRLSEKGRVLKEKGPELRRTTRGIAQVAAVGAIRAGAISTGEEDSGKALWFKSRPHRVKLGV